MPSYRQGHVQGTQGVLKAVSLLVSGAISSPSWLFGLRCPLAGVYGILDGAELGPKSNKLERAFHNILVSSSLIW